MPGYEHHTKRGGGTASTMMQNPDSCRTYEAIRSLLLKAEEPFDHTAHPRQVAGKELWCILRNPVVRHDLPGDDPFKTVEPLAWTTIPCQRMNGEPVIYLRQNMNLVPVLLVHAWSAYLTDMQRAILLASVERNERRIARLLAETEQEIVRTFKEIGAPLPMTQCEQPLTPAKELVGVS